MNEERVSIILAMVIFLLSIPIFFRARRIVRTKAAGRLSRVAREFGLEELDPDGPRMLPLFEWGSVLDPGSGHSVVSAIGGVFTTHEVILAEVEEDADRITRGRLGPSWMTSRARRKSWTSSRWIGPSGLADHLVIFFEEPLPKLPDFRIESRSARGRSSESDPNSWAWEDRNDPEDPLTVFPSEARKALPAVFLDRASRVLIGRRESWAIQGAGHRLIIRVSGWRPRSNVRAYRAVLEDAQSLRETLTSLAEVPEAAEEPRSIRNALERIRSATSAPVDPEGSDGIDS